MRDFITLALVSVLLTSFTFHQLHKQEVDQQEVIVWTR